jgi:hypothetical protein
MLVFKHAARLWLQANAGSFSESDVTSKAYEMARVDLQQRQTPRLPDAEPKRIAAVAFRHAPQQRAEPVLAWRKRSARVSLGDGRVASQEASQMTVQQIVALYALRQPVAAPTSGVYVLSVASVGTPGALGARVADEGSA